MNLLDPAGPQAANIAGLTWVFMGICLAIYAATTGALLWSVRRPAGPEDDSPATARRLGMVVAAATAGTAATLVVLTISSEVAGRGLSKPSGPGAVTVDVIGYQWFWDFRYHDVTPGEWVSSPNELHIPVGVPVVINAMSRDVIHSFWVPKLHGKRDLIPGITTQTWIQADEPGVYRGQCAEFCGHQHAHMAFSVVAHPAAAFQAWLQQQRLAAVPPSASTQRGHDVFMSNTCVTCHAIRGTQAGSRVGPELTHVGSRQTIAAGTLPNTRGHLAGWIADSQSIKPGNRMPPNPLNPSDLQAVLSYVRSLR
jgi:cytochrome c oxidase subunit II